VPGWLAGLLAADARALPVSMRKAIVTNLAERRKQSIDAKARGMGELVLKLRQLVEDAQRERQMSVAKGAHARTDPAWCGASLVEVWANARLVF
jgi:hypothetical protein